MSENTGKALDIGLLSRVLKYVRPYRATFWTTAFLTLAIAALSPLRPILVQYAFDNYIVIPDPSGLLIITLVTLGVLLIEAVAYYFYTYSANWLGQTVIRDIRQEVYDHISSLKLQFFDRTPIGTLVTRVISDIETIADIFANGILVIFSDMLKVVVVVGVMLYIDWKLALISLSTIPVLLVATWIFKNGIRDSFQDVRTQVARLNAFLQEHITGMHLVQVFNREEREMKRFMAINGEHRDANIRSVWYFSIFLPVVEILSAVPSDWWYGGVRMKCLPAPSPSAILWPSSSTYTSSSAPSANWPISSIPCKWAWSVPSAYSKYWTRTISWPMQAPFALWR
jgi:ATP-binding cassette subfamily B multidrug efflux pump